MHSLTLPLTHPHTYLKRRPFKENAEADDPVGFFLSLSASALSHPFYALLLRSPVAGPYMPLLSIQQCHSSAKESRSPSKGSG